MLANAAHLASTIILYHLSLLISDASKQQAFMSATLHICASAGLFLTAPFTESSFAFLNFAGYLCYFTALKRSKTASHIYFVLAGALFGSSTTIRSNGIFNGSLFLLEIVSSTLISSKASLSLLVALFSGGALTGLGFAFPQYIAWSHYCTGLHSSEQRPWCGALPPTIYNFVQERYW